MSKTAICAASGPSLTLQDLKYTRGKATLFAVNDVYKLAPWADVLYSCDFEWWNNQAKNNRDYFWDFKGEKWTINKEAGREFDVNVIGHITSKKWSNDPKYIATGRNSGFQALNLADLRGFDRIILLGYDMKLADDGKRHFFGDHPSPMNKDSDYKTWATLFEEAVPFIRAEVINCTRSTALTCFPRVELEKVL